MSRALASWSGKRIGGRFAEAHFLFALCRDSTKPERHWAKQLYVVKTHTHTHTHTHSRTSAQTGSLVLRVASTVLEGGARRRSPRGISWNVTERNVRRTCSLRAVWVTVTHTQRSGSNERTICRWSISNKPGANSRNVPFLRQGQTTAVALGWRIGASSVLRLWAPVEPRRSDDTSTLLRMRSFF